MEYQHSFNNFLSGESKDAVCKVWYKLVKSPGRSLKKEVCVISQICAKKKKIGINGRGLYHNTQCNSLNTVDMCFLNVQQSICEL